MVLDLIAWWCGLFGVNDAETVRMVVAIIVGVGFFAAIYIVVASVLAIVAGWMGW